MQAFGHTAVHLRLRIDQQKCAPDIYLVAETQGGGHGITYGPRPVLIDFWVQDLGGIPLVVEAWHENNAPSQLVDQIARTRRSVTFVTGPWARSDTHSLMDPAPINGRTAV